MSNPTWQFVDYTHQQSSTHPTTNTPSSSKSKKRKQTDEYLNSDFSSAPFTPQGSMNNSQSIISLTSDSQTIVSVESNSTAYGLHNLQRIHPTEGSLVQSTTRPAPKKKQKIDDKILQSFEKLFDGFFQLLLESMNERREKRIVERNKEKLTGQRGRPSTNSTIGKKYGNSFKKEFTLEDLQSFLACYYRISTINDHELSNYWQVSSDENCGHGRWFKSRISQRMYLEMFRCIDLDIDKWVELMNKRFTEVKIPSKNLCVDESMAPHRGRFNPHFMFIQRKPHPYGTKFETIADEDLFLFRLTLHRRTVNDPEKPLLMRGKRESLDREKFTLTTPKTVPEIVCFLCDQLGPDKHVVVGDSWFGGMDVSTELRKMKIDSVMKCMSSRPTGVWEKVHKEDEDEHSFIVMKGTNDLNETVYAISKKTEEGKFQNLLTTVEFDQYIEKEMMSVDDDGERVAKKEVLHQSFEFYNKVSSFVDEANRSIMSCYYHHSAMDYKTSLFVFFMSLMAHNSRIMYNKENDCSTSQVEFIRCLSNQLSKKVDSDHELVVVEKKSHCVVCYWSMKETGLSKDQIKRTMVKSKCTRCKKTMCESCFRSFKHCEFALKKLNFV